MGANSVFELCIRDKLTKYVYVAWPPGRRGTTAEADLVTDLLARVQAKGVGVTRTEAHVLASVEAAVRELLADAKAMVSSG